MAQQAVGYILVLISCVNALQMDPIIFQGELEDSPVLIKEVISDNYDKLRPPREGRKPVTVHFAISILTIRNVDERELSYEMDVFLHQYWKDNRLKVPSRYNDGKVVLDNKWREEIWTPDIFFKNARDGKLHNIINPYTYIVISNDSQVFFASRLSLKLNCMMDLRWYPHDTQECEVIIMSLQHTEETVVLAWKDFSLTKNILLPQFVVKDHYRANCTKTYDIGTFSCLVGRLKFSRRLGYFILNRYIPSILIVCMSFVTFWVPINAYPARVTLSVTSLLTMVTLQYSISLPSVSYIMAINVWIIGCIVFVFATLLEYTLVVAVLSSVREITSKTMESYKHNSKKNFLFCLWIERSSRILFPACFLLFCIIYWYTYGRAD